MAQGKDFYIPFQDGIGRIHGICWEPEKTPWAVIQVAHGMIEHIGRYDEFAQAMNRAGIAVIGHDHPGHGRTAKPGELGEFAEKNGVRRVIGAKLAVLTPRFCCHVPAGVWISSVQRIIRDSHFVAAIMRLGDIAKSTARP